MNIFWGQASDPIKYFSKVSDVLRICRTAQSLDFALQAKVNLRLLPRTRGSYREFRLVRFTFSFQFSQQLCNIRMQSSVSEAQTDVQLSGSCLRVNGGQPGYQKYQSYACCFQYKTKTITLMYPYIGSIEVCSQLEV